MVEGKLSDKVENEKIQTERREAIAITRRERERVGQRRNSAM